MTGERSDGTRSNDTTAVLEKPAASTPNGPPPTNTALGCLALSSTNPENTFPDQSHNCALVFDPESGKHSPVKNCSICKFCAVCRNDSLLSPDALSRLEEGREKSRSGQDLTEIA